MNEISHMSRNSESLHTSKLDTELNLALKLYFSYPNSYFTQYWPRPLRLFLIKLLTYMINNEPSVNISESDIMLILDTLSSDKPYISVALRKRIKLLLHTIKDHNIMINLPPSQYNNSSTSEVTQSIVSWPNDIIGYDDLKDSLIGWTLRDDVADYLVNHLATWRRLFNRF